MKELPDDFRELLKLLSPTPQSQTNVTFSSSYEAQVRALGDKKITLTISSSEETRVTVEPIPTPEPEPAHPDKPNEAPEKIEGYTKIFLELLAQPPTSRTAIHRWALGHDKNLPRLLSPELKDWLTFLREGSPKKHE